ncbi:helix-turn-helix domain-containing protein [Haloferula sp. BvORR071]|uniref:helix-turn-helix domain-containing protein n=1 Tax=Haloferula sp. BvORR071 TaxID=1396141 RepID=UPI00054EB48D|nr:helix-turn-helix domain-containing protein [Haloferula sp. BvORR071]
MEDFTSRLNSAIERTGMNQSRFAEKAGVGTSLISKWLAGTQMPKSEQLLSLATTAGVSMEWLLTGRQPEGGSEAALMKRLGEMEQRAKAAEQDLADLRRKLAELAKKR